MIFYRRERYMSLFFVVFGGLLLLSYLVLPEGDLGGRQPWASAGLAIGMIVIGGMYFARNHIVLSSGGFDLYYGFWSWGTEWTNIEAVRDVDLGGRVERCIVLKNGTQSGWVTRRILRIHRGRYVEIPRIGPASYHGGDRLVAELCRYGSESLQESVLPEAVREPHQDR